MCISSIRMIVIVLQLLLFVVEFDFKNIPNEKFKINDTKFERDNFLYN